MLFKIRIDDVPLPGELRVRAERRLQFALGRFSNKIRSASIVVLDVNGPRGGVDKVCKVDVRGSGWQVLIEDSDSNAEAALDRAAERAGRAVSRKIARLRDLGRTGPL